MSGWVDPKNSWPNKTKFDKFMNRLSVPYGYRAMLFKKNLSWLFHAIMSFISLTIIAPPAVWTPTSVITSLFIGYLIIIVPLKILSRVIWYGMEIVNFVYESYHYYYTGKRKELPWLIDLYHRWRAEEFVDKEKEKEEKDEQKLKEAYYARVAKERKERKELWHARSEALKDIWWHWRRGDYNKKK